MSVHECFPYLRCADAAAAITFYKRVFGAEEVFRLVDPGDGRVGHAELRLGPSAMLMLSDPYPEMKIHEPRGPQGSTIHLHCDDCDATIALALAAGATLTRAASDQFYGERSGSFRDPFGHEWSVGHSIEKVEPEEMQRRWNAM